MAQSTDDGKSSENIAAGRASPLAANDDDAFQGGVAPEAKIVFVKSKIEQAADGVGTVGSSFAQIVALEFVASVAKEEALPFAINLSFGAHVGAHDGTALLENFIDSMTSIGTNPGQVVIKSAGNEQNKDSQALLDFSPSSRRFLTWNARRP